MKTPLDPVQVPRQCEQVTHSRLPSFSKLPTPSIPLSNVQKRPSSILLVPAPLHPSPKPSPPPTPPPHLTQPSRPPETSHRPHAPSHSSFIRLGTRSSSKTASNLPSGNRVPLNPRHASLTSIPNLQLTRPCTTTVNLSNNNPPFPRCNRSTARNKPVHIPRPYSQRKDSPVAKTRIRFTLGRSASGSASKNRRAWSAHAKVKVLSAAGRRRASCRICRLARRRLVSMWPTK